MLPIGPPYHTVAGNTITIYLNVIAAPGGIVNPIDNVLSQLAVEWGQIAAANGLTIIFALGPRTSAPVTNTAGVSLSGIPDIGILPPNSPGLNFSMVNSAPAGVNFFNFRVGFGRRALRSTRSARLSYVRYILGRGYIYVMRLPIPTVVPHVSHELGHVLGLSDRYYEAVYWLNNWAIDLTCADIRRRAYMVGTNDTRDGVLDNGTVFRDSPRLAMRVTLPMSGIMVPADPTYNPLNNLMSNGAGVLTNAQLNTIRARTSEETYRKTNWVAILADWERIAGPISSLPKLQTELNKVTAKGGWANTINNANDYPTESNYGNNLSAWMFPAWEARQQDKGRGLMFLPSGSTTPFRYGCVSSSGRAEDEHGGPVMATRISIARGKRRVHFFGGATYNTNAVVINNPRWMCHIRQMIADLTS